MNSPEKIVYEDAVRLAEKIRDAASKSFNEEDLKIRGERLIHNYFERIDIPY